MVKRLLNLNHVATHHDSDPENIMTPDKALSLPNDLMTISAFETFLRMCVDTNRGTDADYHQVSTLITRLKNYIDVTTLNQLQTFNWTTLKDQHLPLYTISISLFFSLYFDQRRENRHQATSQQRQLFTLALQDFARITSGRHDDVDTIFCQMWAHAVPDQSVELMLFKLLTKVLRDNIISDVNQNLLASSAQRPDRTTLKHTTYIATLIWPKYPLLKSLVEQAPMDVLDIMALQKELTNRVSPVQALPIMESIYQQLDEETRLYCLKHLNNQNLTRNHIATLGLLCTRFYGKTHSALLTLCKQVVEPETLPLLIWLFKHSSPEISEQTGQYIRARYPLTRLTEPYQSVLNTKLIPGTIPTEKPPHMNAAQTQRYDKIKGLLNEYTDRSGWSFEEKLKYLVLKRLVKEDSILRHTTSVEELIAIARHHDSEHHLLHRLDLCGEPIHNNTISAIELLGQAPFAQSKAGSSWLFELAIRPEGSIRTAALDALQRQSQRRRLDNFSEEKKRLLKHIPHIKGLDIEGELLIRKIALPFEMDKLLSAVEHAEQPLYTFYQQLLVTKPTQMVTDAIVKMYANANQLLRQKYIQDINDHTHPGHLSTFAQLLPQLTPSSRKVLIERIILIEHVAIEPILLSTLNNNEDRQVCLVAIKGLHDQGSRLSLATLYQYSTKRQFASAAKNAMAAIEERYPASEIAAHGGSLSLAEGAGWEGALSLASSLDEGAISLYGQVRQATGASDEDVAHNTSSHDSALITSPQHNGPTDAPTEPTQALIKHAHQAMELRNVAAPPRSIPITSLIAHIFLHRNLNGVFWAIWPIALAAGIYLGLKPGNMTFMILLSITPFFINFFFTSTHKKLLMLRSAFFGEARLKDYSSGIKEHIYIFEVEAMDGTMKPFTFKYSNARPELTDEDTELVTYTVKENGDIDTLMLLDEDSLVSIDKTGQFKTPLSLIWMSMTVGVCFILALLYLLVHWF